MSEEVEMPSELPAMTLEGVVFFPKSMVPLRIFESRYRQMLADVLVSHRMFALLGLDEKAARDTDAFEPPLKTASAGIVRICNKNPDGTFHLLLQGVRRIRVVDIVREEPYRVVKVEPVETVQSQPEPETRSELTNLLEENRELGGEATEEMLKFLNPLEDDEVFVDLAAFVLCKETLRKQRLLETLDLAKRADLLVVHLREENERLRLLNDSMGGLSGDDFAVN
jgi:Lon protease-like protein